MFLKVKKTNFVQGQKSPGQGTQLPKALLKLVICSLEMQIATHSCYGFDYHGTLGLLTIKPQLNFMLSTICRQLSAQDICRGQKDKQCVGPNKSRSRNSQLTKGLLLLATFSLEMQIATHPRHVFDNHGILGLQKINQWSNFMLSAICSRLSTQDVCRGQKDKQCVVSNKTRSRNSQLAKGLLILATFSIEMQIAAHFFDYLGSLGLMTLKPYLLVMLNDKQRQPSTLDICRGQKDKECFIFKKIQIKELSTYQRSVNVGDIQS